MNLTNILKTNTLAAALACQVALAESSGTLDSTFNPGTGPNYATVDAIALQSDGKILLGGSFTTIGGVTAKGIARLNANGTLDTSFTTNPGAESYVMAVVPAGDGTIFVGGSFDNINGATWAGLAKLTSAGLPDPSFGGFSGIHTAGSVHAIALQPDGKILVGGGFASVNGASYANLVRLNPNGSLDTTFNPLLNERVNTIVVRPNGKILVGGEFTQVNNLTRNYLVQLNSNGSTDTAFSAQTDWSVNSIVLLSNGQTVIAGNFWAVNSQTRNKLARLNTDGGLDSTWSGSASGEVNCIVAQPNGKFVITGGFSSVNGTTRQKIAMLTSNGLLDSSFDPGAGLDYYGQALAVQADGKILVGGDFDNASQQARSSLARYWGDPPRPVIQPEGLKIHLAVEITWTGEVGKTYQVQWSPEASPTAWQNFGNPIPGIDGLMQVFDSSRINPKRFYRVIESN